MQDHFLFAHSLAERYGCTMASILFDDHSDGHPNNHYPELNPKSAQIRLIVLARGELDSSIHCTYRVVDLDDEHSWYETFSYVWDDGDGTESISVDGKAASVGRSLFGALEQLRYVDRERTLWIDAICINQSCDNGKTHQVGMMCSIYTQCRPTGRDLVTGCESRHTHGHLDGEAHGRSSRVLGRSLSAAPGGGSPELTPHQAVVGAYVDDPGGETSL